MCYTCHTGRENGKNPARMKKEHMMADYPFHPMSELIAAVKDHAILNYDTDGWDFVVEAYTDDMIRNVLQGRSADGEFKIARRGRVRTPKAAIKRMAEDVGVADDVRSDIINA